MFCATARGAIDSEGLAFEHCVEDIQTLNEWALEGRLEVTAVSCHCYAHIYRDAPPWGLQEGLARFCG